MTFDKWCDSKNIYGNHREALYYHLKATRTDAQQDDETEWLSAWNEVLDQLIAKLT